MATKAKPPSTPAQRLDSWRSQVTAVGVEGYDKRIGATIVPPRLSAQDCENRWAADDMAKRAVEAIPAEMVRAGWEHQVTGEDSSDGKEVAVALDKFHEQIKAKVKVERCLQYARAFGGGGMLLGINDGNGLDQSAMRRPVAEKSIKTFEWIGRPLIANTELQVIQTYGDPSHPKFGEPEIYRIHPSAQIAPSRDPNGRYQATRAADVHESRMLIFPGDQISANRAAMNGGWGDSIFIVADAVLRDFGLTWGSVCNLLQEFSYATWAIKDLASLIEANQEDALKVRVAQMNLARSVLNANVVDAAGESFRRDTVSFAQIPEMLTLLFQRLAAALNTPVTKLLGTAPGGMNANADPNERGWYDTIGASQETDLKDQLEKITRYKMLSKDGPTKGKEPEAWGIQFRPLWQPTEKEKTETEKIRADIDCAYIDRGVLGAEEVALARYSGDRFSHHLQIDVKAREMLEQAEAGHEADPDAPNDPTVDPAKPAPTDPNAKTAGATPTLAEGELAPQEAVLNGAQISAAKDIVIAAGKGEMPRESAIELLVAVFNWSVERATRVVGISGTTAPLQANPIEGQQEAPKFNPFQKPAPEKTFDADAEDREDASYAERRALLVQKLGGKCVGPDCDATTGLEFNHKKPRTWVANTMSKAQRLAAYEKDVEAGHIELLCHPCNARAGKPKG